MNILSHMKEAFGPTELEYIIYATFPEERRFKKLLDTIALIRFIVFPISLFIYILAASLGILNSLIFIVGNWLDVAFNFVNDSPWLPVTWFGLKEEDFQKIEDSLNMNGEEDGE